MSSHLVYHFPKTVAVVSGDTVTCTINQPFSQGPVYMSTGIQYFPQAIPVDLTLVSSEDLMKEVLRRGAFKTIKEYKGKK